MLFRVLYLIALIGVVGGDSRATTSDDNEDSENVRLGGEGFGNVVMVFVALGVAALLAVIVIGVLALSGQFENTVVDPPV